MINGMHSIHNINKMKSLFSPLEQFDIITIIPLWLLDLEISITNLTVTTIVVIIVGFIFFFIFYKQKMVPKS